MDKIYIGDYVSIASEVLYRSIIETYEKRNYNTKAIDAPFKIVRIYFHDKNEICEIIDCHKEYWQVDSNEIRLYVGDDDLFTI